MPEIVPPELPPLIVNGSAGRKYVFTYKNVWDSERKRAVRCKGGGQCVGRYEPVEGEVGCGEIFFYDDFKALYPALKELRVFRRKGGKLEFKPASVEMDRLKRPAGRQLHGGATWALNQFIAGTPLGRAIHSVFGDGGRDLKILSLAFFLVIHEDGCLSNYEEFAEAAWLPHPVAMTGGAIRHFLSTIAPEDAARFQARLAEEFLRQCGGKIAKRRFLALDSTSVRPGSQSFRATECTGSESLLDAPMSNVLLIVDEVTGLPLLWHNFEGNVPDASMIRGVLSKLAHVNVDMKNVIWVRDRASGLPVNCDDRRRQGIGFVDSAPLGADEALKSLIDRHYAELLDWNNEVPFLNQAAVTVPVDRQGSELSEAGRPSLKTPLCAHIGFSKALHQQAEQNLKQRLAAFLKYCRKTPEDDGASGKIIRDGMNQPDAGGHWTISMSKVDRCLRYAGVKVLVSDAMADVTDCVMAFEDRLLVEHAVGAIPSRLSCDRAQANSAENWESKLFLQMIASAVRIMVRRRLKVWNDSACCPTLCVHFDSEHKLLAKLNNIPMFNLPSGWCFGEIEARKQALFSVLGVPVPAMGEAVPAGASAEAPDEVPEEAPLPTADVSVEDL